MDSQRTSFEGRIPNKQIICDIIKFLSNKMTLVIIGQSDNSSVEIENVIADGVGNNSIIDYRDSTIELMTRIIMGSSLFVGLDSGPSHIAQLLDIPSYILYGPINPATKIYRYHNSGCYYNTDPNIVRGSYHVHLEPAYHVDIRGDNKFFPDNSSEIINSMSSFIDSGYKFDWLPIFNSLRLSQREFLMVQMHNPLYRNKILTKQNLSLKSTTDSIIDIMSAFERYANKYT